MNALKEKNVVTRGLFMNEQLKCMEMLLRNLLYSLEHCIAPRDQYIL